MLSAIKLHKKTTITKKKKKVISEIENDASVVRNGNGKGRETEGEIESEPDRGE